MSNNDINVTNTGGDQGNGQNVHRHIVSGMVADLVRDGERRRQGHGLRPARTQHPVTVATSLAGDGPMTG